MSSDSEKPDLPSLSDAYNVTERPADLARVVRQLVRSEDTSRQVDKVHWAQIKENKKAIEELSQSLLTLTQRYNTLETKIAVYVGLGSFIGAILIKVLFDYVFKR